MDRYAAIADYAAERYDAKILLTGGPTDLERDYGRGIIELAGTEIVNLIGTTTLKQLLALLERSTVVLCPDSGPAHMATAVGTPVAGLYATSNRHRTDARIHASQSGEPGRCCEHESGLRPRAGSGLSMAILSQSSSRDAAPARHGWAVRVYDRLRDTTRRAPLGYSTGRRGS